jgi:type IV pilus assembly protein PilC
MPVPQKTMLRGLKVILEIVFWMVAAAALLFGGALAISLGLAPALFFLGIAWVLLAMPLIFRVVTQTRSRRTAVMLTYLEQAVRLNLPLPKMLWAAQRSEPGKTGYRLAQFRNRLEDGLPIAYALEMAAPEVPERHLGILAAAEHVGRLPQALARLTDEIADKARRDVMDVMFYRMYPPLMILVVSAVMAMIGVFVMPKYEQIFKDFGIKLPWLTVTAFEVARVVAPLVAFGAMLAVLWMGGRTLWETFHPQRMGDTFVRGAVDHVLWFLPVAHVMQRDRGLADVLAFLADAMDAAAPLDRALREASEMRVNVVLKGRMREWSRMVGRGENLQSAAREAGMPGLVVGLLATTHAGGGANEELANVFRFLGRYYRSRFSRIDALVQGATVPVVVLIFGVLVGIVALSMFMPMVSLIQNVSVGGRSWQL